MRVSNALVSVADKRGVAEFVAGLANLGIEVISTGGTARLLGQKGIKVTDVASYTGFPEALGGRLKTLHPLIHGALLGAHERPDYRAMMERHGIRPIELVAVNLPPFEQTIGRPQSTFEETIDSIDIGGAALLRSAAKNHRHVTVVTDPDDYERVLAELRQRGEVSPGLRAELALKAFRLAARYDCAIAEYMASNVEGRFPAHLGLHFEKVRDLSHGENPHQTAAFYRDYSVTEPCAGTALQVSGDTALSYSNLLDLDAALELVKEFDGPAAVLIAHTHPCGAAIADSVADAFDRACAASPDAACGALLALNRRLDAQTAARIVATAPDGPPRRLEAIVAPEIERDALRIIADAPEWGSDVRVLNSGGWDRARLDRKAFDLRRVGGGLLVQDRDLELFDHELRIVTQRKPSDAERADLAFAAACAKHAKTCAVALASQRTLVGLCAGQAGPIDAVSGALRKAGDRARGAALASDSPLASPDAFSAAADAGCTAVIQAGTSPGDPHTIEKADELGLVLVLCAVRHFRH